MRGNIIFKGMVIPSTSWIGTLQQPHTKRDRFGELMPGEVRVFYINTKYGQLTLPHQYGNKTIRITLEVNHD